MLKNLDKIFKHERDAASERRRATTDPFNI